MKAVTKYKLQEWVFIVSFFLIAFLISIWLGDTEDFPLFRSGVGALFLGSITAWYEIVIAVRLVNKLNTLFFLLVTFIFYYVLFSVMLISSAYINLIFKVGMTPQEAFSINIVDIYPVGINSMVFYLFLFLFILQLIRQLRVTIVKGLGAKYLKGRLNKPMSDTRIFLFMDLYSSTMYAEKLGHQKYSSFIQEIYKELDEYILATQGTLYQFVGDQVVVVWNVKDGLKNNNCAKFFFMVEDALEKKKEYFTEKYGISPRFKAGLHYGPVAIAEVGNILKREIAYHGDTVNTTARICYLCSELKAKFLISEDLRKELELNTNGINAEQVGEFNLKGKKNEVLIHKLVKNDGGME